MSNQSGCPTESFVRELTKHQTHLQGYIFASLANHADAEDVLQRTNLTLLRKESSFPVGGKFLPWAIAIAKYEILTYIRDNQRKRVVFNSPIVELMCESAEAEAASLDDRQEALRSCLRRLPKRSQQVLQLRYSGEHTLQQIAETTGSSISAVKALLFRIRQGLERCVEQGLNQQ